MTTPWKASNGGTVVKLPSGSTKKVKASDPFGETIRNIARDAGLSKFNVYVDGEEIDAAKAPAKFSGIRTVELKKYDEGA